MKVNGTAEPKRRATDHPLKPKLLSWKTEKALWKRGLYSIVGVDEAGRGPLAGPVVAAAVLFDYECCKNFPRSLRGLNDSKQVVEEERERMFDLIWKHAAAIGVGIVSSTEIDEINILRATMKAMAQAVDEVALKLSSMERVPELLLVDGNYFRTSLPYEFQTIIDGDAISPLIASASIVAKVTRDRIMVKKHEDFPQYNFRRNKGYGTREHVAALTEHGPCPEHRRSFRPDRFLVDDRSSTGELDLQEELTFEIVTAE